MCLLASAHRVLVNCFNRFAWDCLQVVGEAASHPVGGPAVRACELGAR